MLFQHTCFRNAHVLAAHRQRERERERDHTRIHSPTYTTTTRTTRRTTIHTHMHAHMHTCMQPIRPTDRTTYRHVCINVGNIWRCTTCQPASHSVANMSKACTTQLMAMHATRPELFVRSLLLPTHTIVPCPRPNDHTGCQTLRASHQPTQISWYKSAHH